jgi:hypothetical protein
MHNRTNHIQHTHTGVGEWDHFKKTFSDAAVSYMVAHWDTRKRWCAPWSQSTFCAGKSGTAFGESNNGSIKVAWLNRPHEPLIDLLDDMRVRYLEDACQRRLRVAKSIMAHGMLSRSCSRGEPTPLESCRLSHTKYAADAFDLNLQSIHHYLVLV